MPYIKEEKRKEMNDDLKSLGAKIETEGDLNYAMTILAHIFIKNKGLKYANLNTVMGVFHCAAAELYRQVAAPYENEKKRENGNVSTLDYINQTVMD